MQKKEHLFQLVNYLRQDCYQKVFDQILMNFFRIVDNRAMNRWLYFAGDLDHHLNPGIFKKKKNKRRVPVNGHCVS